MGADTSEPQPRTKRRTTPGAAGTLAALIISAVAVWAVTDGAPRNAAIDDLVQMRADAATIAAEAAR